MQVPALESRGILLLVLAQELQLSLLRRLDLLLPRLFMSRQPAVVPSELR